jgi:hypothetical protein
LLCYAKQHKHIKKHAHKTNEEQIDKSEPDNSEGNSYNLLFDSISSDNVDLKKNNRQLTSNLNGLKKANEQLKAEIRDFKDQVDSNYGDIIYIIIIILFLVSSIVAYIIFRKKRDTIFALKSQLKSLKEELAEQKKEISKQEKIIQKYTDISISQNNIATPSSMPKKSITANSQSLEPKSFSNKFIDNSKHKCKGDFYVVYASSIGKSHITNNTSCQDNHAVGKIDWDWGISVVCDGAGSAENSAQGSKFVSEEAYNLYKAALLRSDFFNKKTLPRDDEWDDISNKIIQEIQLKLKDFATLKKIEYASLACTLIVVVYSPIGLLVSHIGDGRAGYLNSKNEWKSLITPHKGEESNQTIFITSREWNPKNSIKMSNVLVPENSVIREMPLAFTLMSDGCESSSYECSKLDSLNQKWTDPNIPFPNFFNPLVTQLKGMIQSKVPQEEANKLWRNFIESGTPSLSEENDDKTLILGIIVS